MLKNLPTFFKFVRKYFKKIADVFLNFRKDVFLRLYIGKREGEMLPVEKVEEIGGFDDDAAVGGTCKNIFLRVLVDVGQSEIVTAFNRKVTDGGVKFCA